MKKKIILASNSPRRKELLKSAGVEFEVIVSDINEDVHICDDPKRMVLDLAKAKAEAVKSKINSDAVIIGADTVVYLDEIFGKPSSKNEAMMMLERLSGRKHSVYTGICICDTYENKYIGKAVETIVEFREITKDEIIEYVDTGEPYDKAGAYAIQGGAAKFVRSVCGDYNNVVGLPLAEVLEAFDILGIQGR